MSCRYEFVIDRPRKLMKNSFSGFFTVADVVG